MKNLLNFFKKREHHEEYIFTDEDFVFQHNFKRYYVRKIYGSIEFWCRDIHDERLNFYLGKLVKDKIILSKAFYTHPYDVQKGGSRLARIYLYNDDRW